MLEDWLKICQRKNQGSMIFGQQLVHFPQLEEKLNSKVKLDEKKNLLKIDYPGVYIQFCEHSN